MSAGWRGLTFTNDGGSGHVAGILDGSDESKRRGTSGEEENSQLGERHCGSLGVLSTGELVRERRSCMAPFIRQGGTGYSGGSGLLAVLGRGFPGCANGNGAMYLVYCVPSTREKLVP